jgi:UDP-sugar transporter A1/2/3
VTQAGPRYFPTTAVFWMEFIKLLAALLVIFYQKNGSVGEWFSCLRNEVCSSHEELLKLAVPSFLYTIQNNILYVAIANLGMAAFFFFCFSFPFFSLSRCAHVSGIV